MANVNTERVLDGYVFGDYLFRPEMKKALNDVMKDPDANVEFSDKFFDPKPKKSNCLFNLINRIERFFTLARFYIRMSTDSYRKKFDRSVRIINDQYHQQVTEFFQERTVEAETSVRDTFSSVLPEGSEEEVVEEGSATVVEEENSASVTEEGLESSVVAEDDHDSTVAEEDDSANGTEEGVSMTVAGEELSVVGAEEEGSATEAELSGVILEPAKEVKKKKKSPCGKFISAIKKNSNEDLGVIIKRLMKRGVGEERVVSWHYNRTTHIGTLKLNQTIRVWVPSEKDGREDPKGGVVMILGEETKKVRVKLSEDKLEFLEGFDTYCRPSQTGVREATVSFDSISFISREEIEISAAKRKDVTSSLFGLSVKLKTKTFEETRTFEYLKGNWGRYGIDLTEHEDYKSYLKA